MAMSSYDYWKKREDLNRKNQVKDQKRREAWLRDTYEDMMKSCTDQIEAFYARYAHRNGITIAEARKRVAELDIKAYSRKARKYVKEKDFSETANEEMALYNLTMKVNRLEMLKAQMNLELTAGFDSVDKYFKGELRDAALDEYKRMAGILGKTVQNPTRRAGSLVNASFKNATFSQRIWQHHNALINTLSIELTNALIQGKHPRDLAKIVASKFGVYRYAAERLMITEVARVQTGAQKEAYERNGYGKYVFITEAKPCPDCARLAGQQFELKDMQPGENAPPMHPICRCSTAAAMDQDEFEKWLAGKEDARKMLSRGEVDNDREPMARRADVGDWPPPGEKISEQQLLELIAYGEKNKIDVKSFESYDGDIELIKSFIDSVVEVAKDYPRILSDKRRLQLRCSYQMEPDDYAETTNNCIVINGNAFRKQKALEDDYNKQQSEDSGSKSFFVKGTTYKNIPHHECGHLIIQKYALSPKKITMRIDTYSISEYAAKKASEAIAESFSAFYAGVNNNNALLIKQRCDKIIAERRGWT